jgi:hypothetical protein
MFIWTFLLRIIDTTTSQNIYYSSWNTLYSKRPPLISVRTGRFHDTINFTPATRNVDGHQVLIMVATAMNPGDRRLSSVPCVRRHRHEVAGCLHHSTWCACTVYHREQCPRQPTATAPELLHTSTMHQTRLGTQCLKILCRKYKQEWEGVLQWSLYIFYFACLVGLHVGLMRMRICSCKEKELHCSLK